MKANHKLLIVDDDLYYSGMLALRIRQHFPEINVSSMSRDDVVDGYDIYILDNDFGGKKRGAFLAENLRQKHPECLIIILSATLEKDMLMRLVNCHAAGVFDKGQLDDLKPLFELVENYTSYKADADQQEAVSLGTTMAGIKSVLSQWNERLSIERQ